MKNNLSEGSLLKNMIRFSLPFLASNVVQSLYNVADMLIVGRFSGVEGMSGVNIGGQVTLVLTMIIIGLCMGGTVLIGQYVGANKQEELKKNTATLITLLLGMSLIITVVTLVFKEPLLRLIQTPAESYAESNRYLTVTLTGLVFIFGYNALSAILRGMGDSKRPFYFVCVACAVNILLDLLFVKVFQWSAFGAGLATVISQAVSVILCVIYMVRNGFQFDFKPSSYRIDKEQLRMIIKIGLPSCVQNSIVSMSFLFITAMVNDIGMYASAAVGAVGKFNSFAFMPTAAISASIATISAQNIGAGKLDRAVRACAIGTAVSVVLTYVFFFLIRVYPAEILRMFVDDQNVIDAGIIYIRAFSFDLLLIPFVFCVNGLFMGGGHTTFSMMNSIASSLVFRIPACYIFGVTLNMGLGGVGLGAPVASAGSLLIIVLYLVSGRWKENRVIAASAKPAAVS
jgi:putative MATE family efflux protein